MGFRSMEFKLIASNRKAFRNFTLLDRFECGISLKGSEVKSLRAGGVSFADAFARFDGGEVFLYNLHINPYQEASYLNLEPARPRKLLMHKNEIHKITGLVNQKKFVLIPTKIYFNKRGYAKVELGLGKGKKHFDRREDIKKRDVEREMKRAEGYQRRGR